MKKTVKCVTKIYEAVKKLEQKLYSIAMEYRSIVLDEKKRESEAQAEIWENMHIHYWVVG